MPSGTPLLYVTLGLTLASFIATLYVILRTLLPLVGPHLLSRYSRPATPLPAYGFANAQAEKKQLKSAQRFQCWLAFIDLSTCGVWLWEVVALASGSASSPARMAFAICARPTVLLVVSLLSYLNVIRGKVVDLGRFDIIVWIPSLVLLAVLVSLAYVAPASSAIVWTVMMAVETALLCVCSWCFGRLLFAVFSVRQATMRSQMIRHRFVMQEKEDQQRLDGGIPELPPIRTNRWLISKTFLMAKASTAANTLAASVHRRSQSTNRIGRPSSSTMRTTTGEPYRPRPSESSSSDAHANANSNEPFGFLNYDPTTTTRFGHFRHTSNSQAESGFPATPRSITFSNNARPTSPAPTVDRLGALSRMTDRSRISGDEPRPSMGSYLSTESNSTETGVIGYLGGSRLVNGRNGLSRREAKKAGARMGGHLIGCVASWTLILPFLIYKIESPERAAPFFATLLVALGISLSGPLLAIQTIIAEGFWYSTYLPPLMASSSAVAFEQLASRAVTPALPDIAAPLMSPTTATATATATTAAVAQLPNTASTATSSVPQGGHRATGSNSSSSQNSLASLQAFSNAPPGVIKHSTDTRDAPPGMFARALSMASPHPKLQVIGRGGGSSAMNSSTSLENTGTDEEDWRKKEAKRFKTFSMRRNSTAAERRRSNTLNTLNCGKENDEKRQTQQNVQHQQQHVIRSALAPKNPNRASQGGFDRTPSPSMKSIRSTSSRATNKSDAHSRRSSAPATPRSTRIDEHGAIVQPQNDSAKKHQSYTVDSFTASLLTSLVPGVKVRDSSITHRRSAQAPDEVRPTTPESTTSSKRKPNLSISIASKESTFTKCDEAAKAYAKLTGETEAASSAIIMASMENGGDENKHLRRRSWKSTAGSTMPADRSSGKDEAEGNNYRLDDTHVTRRKVTPTLKLYAASVEAKEEEYEMDEKGPTGPRPSLEDIDEEFSMVQDDKIEVLSDGHSTGLLTPISPMYPQVEPGSPYIDIHHAGPSRGEDDRPSIILRTKTSQPILSTRRRGSNDEFGTVATAQRISRTVSHRSSYSSDMLMRSVSQASNHSRSSTVGSITSAGFRNMIASNRNSWTSVVGNDSFRTLELPEEFRDIRNDTTAPASAQLSAPMPLAPLSNRDLNKHEDRSLGQKDDMKLVQPGTPTLAPPSPASRSPYASPQRIALADLRARQQTINDENDQTPPSPTPRRIGSTNSLSRNANNNILRPSSSNGRGSIMSFR